ncbi:anaerobic ribonucleoside-triphosphate reductase [Vibrio phage VH7D]|uniref:Anaerobic ribonucleoside-triphosphate reductase n=1 Tax=Vibrio phage VH7D TaxID=1262539 RepID=V9LZ01_9CAUD|nr:anaerobic ribonucleoside reductase large subunit [Vibrio phage VH7D]AGB07019.1 anaerobic ribonucleoside-triphosphate reductase [Vibrio phage VH7D]
MKHDILDIVSGSGNNKENANKDSKVIPTMRDLVAGTVSKHYALEDYLPKHIADAHIDGDIHFHDLDYSPLFPQFNCMLIDIKGMFEGGFKMGNAEIEEPNSISTAATVVTQIIQQVSSHIYGGNTINRIDEVLAPYVRKSYYKWLEVGREEHPDSDSKAAIFARKRVEKETFDAFQTFEYQVNTMQTSNGQTPFTTINFGLGTSWEEKLIQKSILQNRIAGLGKTKKTAIFPKLVFTLRDGVNLKEGDPCYAIKKLALECASKRMYPDILNYDKLVETTGGFKSPMGCRSFLGDWKNEDGETVFDGRNNLGVVSINIPRIAIEASGDTERFFEILHERCTLAYEALMLRIKRFDDVTASVAPILYCEGAMGVRLKPTDKVSEVFKHGRSSISLGYIGLHEAVTLLSPDKDMHTFESQHKQFLAEKIVETLRAYTDAWKELTGYGFSLYSTPSESLCDRFCRLDQEKYGVITGINDKDYYTNSFHLDVFKKVNPFEKIDFEAAYPIHANGGFICYAEFPNMRDNIKGLERVWDYAYTKVAYFGTNTPIDQCTCGWSGEAHGDSLGYSCPVCGERDPEKLNVTRRVCGYLGNPGARGWNHGKTVEMQNRVKHC